MRIARMVAVVSGCLALAACGSADKPDTPAGPSHPVSPDTQPAQPSVNVCDTARPPAGYEGFCHDKLMRVYVLHLPQPTPTGKYPLLISLHGALSTANGHGFDALADSAGIAVVYPEGTRHPFGTGNGPLWNAGGVFDAATGSADDVGFIRALIDTLEARYPVDRGRVFAYGYSNGGMLAYRLAHELSSRIAAISSMSGPEITMAYSPPTDLVAIHHVHGLTDTETPYSGGNGFASVPSTIQAWRTLQGCAQKPDTLVNTDGVLGLRWRSPSGRGDVVLYTHAGGHFPTTTVDMGFWSFFKSLPPRPSS